MLWSLVYKHVWVPIFNSFGYTARFQVGKGVIYLYLFNLHAEYIIWNTKPNEAQAGIKVGGENTSDLRRRDGTTLTAESEEELKSLLMKAKEQSERAGLKLNIQKTKIMAFSPITSWQTGGETVETVADFIFLGSKITADGDWAMKLKDAYSLEGKLWPT